MDVERGNQIVDPILEDGIRVLRDVFDIPIQNYGKYHYLITTTSAVIHEILKEYRVTMSTLKRFLKRLDVFENLICKPDKETGGLISRNGRTFKREKFRHIGQRGYKQISLIADLTILHEGNIRKGTIYSEEEDIRITIFIVDGILLQDDQNLKELLLLHIQPNPGINTNTSLLHLDSLPYGIIVDMVRKGTVEPLHLCGTTRRLREYCERSFHTENTQREVRQYIYYVALQKDNINVDLITLRSGLSNKEIYLRYVKIKDVYANFVEKIITNRKIDLRRNNYPDIIGLLYISSNRVGLANSVRPAFMHYKLVQDSAVKLKFHTYTRLIREFSNIANSAENSQEIISLLTSLPRDPQMYAEILSISTEELYRRIPEPPYPLPPKYSFEFFMTYYKHLAEELSQTTHSRNQEFEELKTHIQKVKELRLLSITDAEIYMLVDLHMAVINGTISAIDPFDINTVIMSIP
jgi:hypothetical protein